MKSASGAFEKINFVEVTNLNKAIDIFKKNGLLDCWIR